MSGFITPENDVGSKYQAAVRERTADGRNQAQGKCTACVVLCMCVCTHEPMTNLQFSLLGSPPPSSPPSPCSQLSTQQALGPREESQHRSQPNPRNRISWNDQARQLSLNVNSGNRSFFLTYLELFSDRGMMGAQRQEAQPSSSTGTYRAEGDRNLLLRFFLGVECPL